MLGGVYLMYSVGWILGLQLLYDVCHNIAKVETHRGRELVVQLRPADLGHLTIRVTMTDGIMQATIIADRPEAARMLQQSLGNLDAALGDLGYSLDNLDVAYQGQDPRDAQASSQRKTDGAVTGEVLEADGTPAVSGTTTSSGPGAPGRLDILA